MDFVLAIGSDWQGLYLNGTLVTQSHVLSASEILRAMDGYILSGSRMTTEIKEVDDAWLEYQGLFPENIESVKFTKFTK